jgi:hypothetical protein
MTHCRFVRSASLPSENHTRLETSGDLGDSSHNSWSGRGTAYIQFGRIVFASTPLYEDERGQFIEEDGERVDSG